MTPQEPSAAEQSDSGAESTAGQSVDDSTAPAKRRARAQDSALHPGDLLLDRFEIVSFLAKGGAGEVYEALDTELRTTVALKIIRADLANSERAMERFRREIALARQVTHPNVCRIFDVFRYDLPPTRECSK